MSISHSQFAIIPNNSTQYQLKWEFCDKEKHVLSGKTFTFIQTDTPSETTLLDVYSQNGDIRWQDAHKVSAVAKKILPQTEFSNQASLGIVLDLTDSNRFYLNATEIADKEAALCSSLFEKNNDSTSSEKTPLNLFKKAFDNPLEWVVTEGSLKARLLPLFSKEEQDYFSLTSRGSTDLCQLAEFFINAFKFGQTAQTQGPLPISFSAKEYIASAGTFRPCRQSLVLYPESYQNLYSPQAPFATAISHAFKVSGSTDQKTGVTSMLYSLQEGV